MAEIRAFDPDDNDLRFELAYQHSESENYDLALLHYSSIPTEGRSLGSWNNLGVALQKFSLKGKAVHAFRQAEALGETLAMSNLANQLMSAGFYDEASKICANAFQVPNHHKNIEHSMKRLVELPDEEGEKETETIKEARPKSEFYKEFGRALCRNDIASLAGSWRGPLCVFQVEVTDTRFTAVGTYETPRGASLGLALSSLAVSAPSKPIRHRIQYKGVIRGHTIEAVVEVEDDELPMGAGAGLLSGFASEKKALMILTEEKNEIKILEGSDGASRTISSWTRTSIAIQ